MPELDGFHALTEVRRTPTTARVPFVLLSGVGVNTQDFRRGMNLGADDFLIKPFTPDELRTTVYARLRRHGLGGAGPDPDRVETLPGGAMEDPLAALAVLDGRFKLLRRVTVGGMGTIYEGVDLTDETHVAVKIAPALDETRTARLEREADALRALHDPHIVSFRHMGRTAEGALFVVMDWLEGHDLQHELAQGILSVDDTLTIGVRVASALAAIANVLLEDSPRLRTLRPELSESIDTLLADMMGRVIDQRPRDGAEVLARLRTIQAEPRETLPP